MKSHFLFFSLFLYSISCLSQKLELITTTEQEFWKRGHIIESKSYDEKVNISSSRSAQTMEGFGGCFNELGWTSLSCLDQKDQESIMKELFAPGIGANFTICRMPVGANDFSLDWYSYDEQKGDFDMANFSISNDLSTLIPYIKKARSFNPNIKIWASPWSPPSWMKWNNHYACSTSSVSLEAQYRNDLSPEKNGKEGSNMFIQEEKYFRAYALYFSKFIEEYKKQGIIISLVMPQNEFNSCQIFPSCTWTAAGLAKFIGGYLGPAMKNQNVELMFGTMERPSEALVDSVLSDSLAGKYICGVGFQWAGKDAIPGIYKRYPNIKLYQTEQECGDGKNDWKHCKHSWDLMRHYITNGASSYMYWNIALSAGGVSRWGWSQNSLITVDKVSKSYSYNYEYYLLKHISHFVANGAKRLVTTGTLNNLLAFENTDKSIVVLVQNETRVEKQILFNVNNRDISVLLKPDSFNTLIIK